MVCISSIFIHLLILEVNVKQKKIVDNYLLFCLYSLLCTRKYFKTNYWPINCHKGGRLRGLIGSIITCSITLSKHFTVNKYDLLKREIEYSLQQFDKIKHRTKI